MVEISPIFAALIPSIKTPAGDGKDSDLQPANREIRDREIHDTVELSGGGPKMVNLARGRELAAEIRSKPVDEDFFKFLADAMKDIFRISKLFGETFTTLFRLRR